MHLNFESFITWSGIKFVHSISIIIIIRER